MDSFLRYGKCLFYQIIEMLIILLVLSFFYYYHFLSFKAYSLLKIIFLLFSIFINSFFLGKKCSKKGYLTGLLYGLILILLSFGFVLSFSKFHLKLLYFYGLILSSTILGSIVGINKKRS